MYNLALSTLNEHLVIQSASNSHFLREQFNEGLLYLSVEERYAESGLEDLTCTREAPSADTLLYRLKKLKSYGAYGMLVDADDAVIEKMRRRGMFRKPFITAIDLTDYPYYGEYNNREEKQNGERDQSLLHLRFSSSRRAGREGGRVTTFRSLSTSSTTTP